MTSDLAPENPAERAVARLLEDHNARQAFDLLRDSFAAGGAAPSAFNVISAPHSAWAPKCSWCATR
jgi:hypothetical protein